MIGSKNSWNEIILESGILACGNETLNCSKVFSGCSGVSIKLKQLIFPVLYPQSTNIKLPFMCM